MRTHRKILRDLSDHELEQALMRVFLDWRFSDPADNDHLALWTALRAEWRRRARRDAWKGCTCQECFMDPQIGSVEA